MHETLIVADKKRHWLWQGLSIDAAGLVRASAEQAIRKERRIYVLSEGLWRDSGKVRLCLMLNLKGCPDG